MSRWSEEFENHPIHQQLNQIIEFLGTEVVETDAAFEDERRRLNNVVANLRQIINGLDAEFFPKQLLDQINTQLSHPNFSSQLQTYSNSPSFGNLEIANNHITSNALHIFQLAAMSRPVETQEVISNTQKAFASFTSSMESAAKDTDQQFTEHKTGLLAISTKADELETQLSRLEKSTNEKLSEWQDDFTEKQTTRAEEHSEAQIEREEKFATALKEQQDNFEKERSDTVELQAQSFDTAFENFTASAKLAKSDIKLKQTEIRKLHGLVTDETVAGGYHKGAQDEKLEANSWRIRSLICLGLAVIWLAIKYYIGFTTTEAGTVSWPNILTVSSLTAILLYAAGYTSRQSSMHRKNEKLLRSYALETQALDPFIASLKTTEQQAIKAELVRRMFGQQNEQGTNKPTKLDDGTVNTLIDKVSDIMTESIKKIANK